MTIIGIIILLTGILLLIKYTTDDTNVNNDNNSIKKIKVNKHLNE